MRHEEYQYLDLLKDIIENGDVRENRTGIKTRSLFGSTMRFSLRNETFPVFTTRKIFYRAAIEEILWMIRGKTDSKLLEDKNIHIWNGNTTLDFIKKRGLEDILPEGDIGTLYGFQMRNWGGDLDEHLKGSRTGIDQIKRVIELIETEPDSRRILISNYNVSQLKTGVLEPCHTLCQFNVNKYKKEISSILYMRSIDSVCGFCINALQYSLLTILLGKITAYSPKEFIFMGGDTHIYENHLENLKIQLEREPYPFPKLKINKEISNLEDIEGLEFKDFELLNYRCHPALKYEMAI